MIPRSQRSECRLMAAGIVKCSTVAGRRPAGAELALCLHLRPYEAWQVEFAQVMGLEEGELSPSR